MITNQEGWGDNRPRVGGRVGKRHSRLEDAGECRRVVSLHKPCIADMMGVRIEATFAGRQGVVISLLRHSTVHSILYAGNS